MKPHALRSSILVLVLCCFVREIGAQQSAPTNAATDASFILDPNKPYAYLELDHVGPRNPLRKGEPPTGLWVRIINNCKIGIIVVTIEDIPQNIAVALTLQDEVVPNPKRFGEDARGGAIFAPSEFKNKLENMNDIVRFPNMTEEEVRAAEDAQRNSKLPPRRPLGYNFYNGFDSFGFKLIPPGGSEIFSLPVNHVSPNWHFEIPFRLAVTNPRKMRGPYSHLAFYQEDLDRTREKAPTPTKH